MKGLHDSESLAYDQSFEETCNTFCSRFHLPAILELRCGCLTSLVLAALISLTDLVKVAELSVENKIL